ncbi:MAG: ABC transporter ATP-binding protein [Candidatus Eisenbacteria bacterium]|nr:ABC transporter ATP-binding protein [Candidatus Eisenbacteria bacterium]
MGKEPLLEVEDLRVFFATDGEIARVVDAVSLSVRKGEVLGLVGESGCGKSVTALSILRLIPEPPGRIAGGCIRFLGRDLLRLSESEMRRIRGNAIAMVFQEPTASLNPVLTCGFQVEEAFRLHRRLRGSAAREAAVEALRLVGIPDPEARAGDYPHRLSGGMRQRVLLAIALACRPALLIADEPTTALDVTIQAQILRVLLDLKEQLGMSVLLITHDLGVVAEAADRVAVMYAGEIVEEGDAASVLESPRHPYTQALLRAAPRADGAAEALRPIEGSVPDPRDHPSGCRFHPRCPIAESGCREAHPRLVGSVRCFLAEGGGS